MWLMFFQRLVVELRCHHHAVNSLWGSTSLGKPYAAHVPFMRRNLVSISALKRQGYSFIFGNRKWEFRLVFKYINESTCTYSI